MALSINWTDEAIKSYENIIIYLQKEWAEKEVRKFINRTANLISNISHQPYIFKASSYKQIRQAVIGKLNSLFYPVKNDDIYLLTIWDNRLDPAKNKYS